MRDARELIAASSVVLLDFDGPVCAVFAGISDAEVAAALRRVVAAHTVELPDDVQSASDPFVVLRHAAQIGPACVAEVERAFTEWELRAVAMATETPGAREVLAELHATSRCVVIVSNNSAGAIRRYLDAHGLAPFVGAVIGRVEGRPDLLKPHPHLLSLGLDACAAQAADAVFIGDSESDLEAGAAAGVPTIGYANKPGKRIRFEPLSPAAIVEDLLTLI